jgi:hypothetical protein
MGIENIKASRVLGYPFQIAGPTFVEIPNRHVILAICFETLKKFRASFVSISWEIVEKAILKHAIIWHFLFLNLPDCREDRYF